MEMALAGVVGLVLVDAMTSPPHKLTVTHLAISLSPAVHNRCRLLCLCVRCPDCVPLAEALSVAVVLHVERHACSESRLSDSPPSSLSQTDVCMHDSNVNTVADIGEGDVGVGPFSEPLCGSKSTDRDVDQCTGCGGEGCEVVPVETEKGDAVRGIFDKISNVVKQQGLGEADDECWRLSGHQKRRHDMNSPSVESSIGHVNKPSGQSTVAGWNADEEYDGESVGVKLESLRSNVRLVIDFPDKHQGAFITDVAQVHLSRCDVCRHLMQIVSCKGWKDCSVFMTVPGLPTGQQRLVLFFMDNSHIYCVIL